MKRRLMSVFFIFSSAGLIGHFPPGWCAVEAYWIWTNYIAPERKQQERRTEGGKEIGLQRGGEKLSGKTTVNLLCYRSNSDLKLKWRYEEHGAPAGSRHFMEGGELKQEAWQIAQRRQMYVTAFPACKQAIRSNYIARSCFHRNTRQIKMTLVLPDLILRRRSSSFWFLAEELVYFCHYVWSCGEWSNASLQQTSGRFLNSNLIQNQVLWADLVNSG